MATTCSLASLPLSPLFFLSKPEVYCLPNCVGKRSLSGRAAHTTRPAIKTARRSSPRETVPLAFFSFYISARFSFAPGCCSVLFPRALLSHRSNQACFY